MRRPTPYRPAPGMPPAAQGPRPPGRPGAPQPPIDHRGKVEVLACGNRLGDRRLPHRGRAAGRVVVWLPEKLHRAGQPVLDCGKTRFYTQGQIGVAQPRLQPQQSSPGPADGPSDDAQHHRRKDNQHPAVPETEEIVDPSQRDQRRQHRRGDHAQDADRQQSHDPASQGFHALLEGVGHGKGWLNRKHYRRVGNGSLERLTYFRAEVIHSPCRKGTGQEEMQLSLYYATVCGQAGAFRSIPGCRTNRQPCRKDEHARAARVQAHFSPCAASISPFSLCVQLQQDKRTQATSSLRMGS